MFKWISKYCIFSECFLPSFTLLLVRRSNLCNSSWRMRSLDLYPNSAAMPSNSWLYTIRNLPLGPVLFAKKRDSVYAFQSSLHSTTKVRRKRHEKLKIVSKCIQIFWSPQEFVFPSVLVPFLHRLDPPIRLLPTDRNQNDLALLEQLLE